MILLSILCVILFLSYLVGKQGEKKEIGFTNSFLLSLFFSPIISMLFVINSSVRKNTNIDLLKEVEKVVPTKEEQEYQKQEYQKSDIRNRVVFLIVFLITLIAVYLIK